MARRNLTWSHFILFDESRVLLSFSLWILRGTVLKDRKKVSVPHCVPRIFSKRESILHRLNRRTKYYTSVLIIINMLYCKWKTSVWDRFESIQTDIYRLTNVLKYLSAICVETSRRFEMPYIISTQKCFLPMVSKFLLYIFLFLFLLIFLNNKALFWSNRYHLVATLYRATCTYIIRMFENVRHR